MFRVPVTEKKNNKISKLCVRGNDDEGYTHNNDRDSRETMI